MKKNTPLFMLLFIAAAHNAPAQVIYAAKEIITMDANNDIYTDSPGIAVDNEGRILSVGKIADLSHKYGGPPINHQFDTCVFMPGFVEAHTHIQVAGMAAALPYTGYFTRPGINGVQQGITNIDSIVPYLRSQLQTTGKLHTDTLPLYTSGADPIYFKCGRFTHALLDSVTMSAPVIMQAGSGHIVICNTMLLNAIEKTPGWSSLPPNAVVKDPVTGAPTGELDEVAAVELALETFNAMYKAATHEYFYSPARLTQGIKDGGTLMSKAGITTATELFFTATDLATLAGNYALYRLTAGTANFPVRAVMAFDGYGLYNMSSHYSLDSCTNWLKLQKHADNQYFITGPVKFAVDGSIQGYTAQLTFPYITQPSNPFWNIQPSTLGTVVAPYLKAGFPVAFHANGDAAISLVLRVLDSLKNVNNAPGIWATIEHDQVTETSQYDSIKALKNVGSNLFVNHIYYYGQQHATCTVGPARAFVMDDAHLADSLGIPYALHSDAPVTPAQPLFTAWIATHRTPAYFAGMNYNDSVFGDTISTPQALYAITMGAAKLLNLDNVIGSIEPGKWADFVMLSSDPYNFAQAQLNAIQVEGTIKGGLVIWQQQASKVKKPKPRH